jgi:serine protease Do
MVNRKVAAVLVTAGVVLAMVASALADQTADEVRAVAGKIAPSLVIVSFYVEPDSGGRVDARVLGTVVGPKNLVMVTSLAISDRVSITQYHDFEIVVVKGSELQTYAAEYLGKDDTAQVAFLRIKDAAAPELPPLKFDEDVKLQLGDPVFTFGNLGETDNYKIIGQVQRVVGVVNVPYTFYLLSGSGSQGTPVVTLDGKVVGIMAVQGMNRGTNAKPNRTATEVIWPTERFIARVKSPPEGGQLIKRPWLGVATLNPVTKDLATLFGLGDRRGVVVGQVIADTPADKAGLKGEDLILSLNGKNIAGSEGQLVESFQNQLKEMKIGEEATLEVYREGKVQTIKVTLTEQPPSAAEAKRYKNAQFGLTVRDMVLMDTIARELPNNEKGVVVAFVEPSGWAQEGGLLAEDIIKKVQDREVTSVEQFKKMFEDEVAKKPKEVVLSVLRGKKETKLIRMEPRWGEQPPTDKKAAPPEDSKK